MDLDSVRNRHLFLLDALVLLTTPLLALILRLDDLAELRCVVGIPGELDCYVTGLIIYTVLALVVRLIVFYLYGLYNRFWRYASVEEMKQIVLAVFVSSAIITPIFFLLRAFIPAIDLPRSIPIIDALLVLVYVGGSRFSLRMMVRWQKADPDDDALRVLVMGAGDAGTMIMRELQNSPHLKLHPVGFLDDDPAKHKMRILGVRVYGGREVIPSVVKREQVNQVIIAMPTAPGKAIREIVQICEAAGVGTRTVPGIYELLDGSVSVNQLRNVHIEDLLRREPVQTDTRAVQALLQGKRVLVTGSGGSIGSELCRQILHCRPAQLVLLGHGENSIFSVALELQRQIQAGGLQTDLVSAVADIRFPERITSIFGQYRPQVVFHTAAHKHVPLMELNPVEAITNNVLGTQNVLLASIAHEVEHFVFVSSDKAVNPTSIMGASKRMAELLVLEAGALSDHAYSAVRFGNVLGSRGSVVLTFKQQIAAGGPVTVTDPEMTRYFMTIPEAVQLVLQAAELGSGGEIFVLDMGEPVRIMDLARDLIELSGLEIGRDIDIQIEGRRPGEKLHEELFVSGQQYERTSHGMIFIAANGEYNPNPQLAKQVEELAAAAERNDEVAIRRLLKSFIPEYQPAEQTPLQATAVSTVTDQEVTQPAV